MRFDEHFIQRVIEANNLVDIISQYTELKGRGTQHLGLCPFPDHNEKTPSFSVSESKQLYHCFGCKKAGNIITFLKTYNGFSFVEAIKYLAHRARIELPHEPSQSARFSRRVSTDVKKQMYRANKLAAIFYHKKLKSLSGNHKLRAYLKKRNLTPETIDQFRLGYAAQPWDDLTKFLESRGVPTEISEKLGLIRPNKKRGGHFDLFRDRLMFPIFSIDSEVIGFGGRIIDQGQPKYINSVESDVFKKGQSFYGIEKSAKFIRSEDSIFIVEGYMDLLALYSRGVKNVVATLGTALTESHVKLLQRWSKNVILLFDGDQAGSLASARSLPHFFKYNLSPQIFDLPHGQDPDDYISEHGSAAFTEQAKQSMDLFLHLMQGWFKGFRGEPKHKIQIVDQAAPLLKTLSDRRLQQMYVDELAGRLNEEAGKVLRWVMESGRQGGSGKAGRPVKPVVSVAEDVAQAKDKEILLQGVSEDELALLSLSLKSLKYMDFFVKHQGLEILSHEKLKNIFTQVVDKYGQEPGSFDRLTHFVVSRLENPEKIIHLISSSPAKRRVEQDENLLKECFIRVKDRYLQRQASALVTQMKNNPSDIDLAQFVNIQDERKALKDLKKTPLGE